MKLLEVSRVAPANSAVTELTLPFTFLDLYYFKIPTNERLFFYSVPGLDPTRFNDSVLPNLKHSLALTLAHYLPLAGNILWPYSSPKPIFRYCPGDAVTVSVSESAADFDLLSGDDARGTAESRPLAPGLFVSHARASVMAVSITLFPSSGFCIGVASHHSILDGRSNSLFLRSWSHICRELVNGSSADPGLPPELRPSFDRTAIGETIPEGRGLDMVSLYLKRLNEGNSNSRSLMLSQDVGDRSNDLVLGTFKLTPADIEKLRDRAMKTEQYSVSRLSTFVVSAAYALTHNLRAVMLTSSEQDRALIGFAVDYRTRLGAPLPANYIGNCAVGQILEVEETEWVDPNGFARLAVKMSEMIRDLEKGVLRAVEDRLPNMASYSKYRAVGIMGSTRLGSYRVDFGFGAPKRVVTQSNELSGNVSLSESRDGSGGVEFGVVLTQPQMQQFQASFQDGLNSP